MVNPDLPRVILVVDDDRLIRSDIVENLRDADWTVLEAEDDVSAMMHVEARVDILFTDIDLKSRRTGWDIAIAFRLSNPRVAVIYASGQPAQHDLKVHGSLFFSKPYKHEEVIAACSKLASEFN